MAKYFIIGAGISGLCVAYFLKKQGHDVKIYEKKPTFGGLIKTEICPEGLVHHGPHLMRTNLKIDEFFQEIGVKTLPAINIKKSIAKISNSKIFKVNFPVFEIIKTIFRLFYKRKKTYTNLDDFATHHYGKFVASNFIKSICNGIYACQTEKLHEEIALKKLYFHEKRAIYSIIKNIFKAKNAQIITPCKGFGEITQKLAEILQENIEYNTEIEDLSNLDGKIIITTPAFCAKNLQNLPNRAKELLEKIEYSGVDVTTIFTKKPISMQGIGVLTPQNTGILGILFNSSAFGQNNSFHSYSVFSKNLKHSEIEEQFSKIFNIYITKSYFNNYQNSIPIYNLNVKNFIEYNNNLGSKIKFFSNYTGSIAIGEIITSAKEFAKNVT